MIWRLVVCIVAADVEPEVAGKGEDALDGLAPADHSNRRRIEDMLGDFEEPDNDDPCCKPEGTDC